jgi:hypothetical protein
MWSEHLAPPPRNMRFPRCAACQKAPGKLCPGHGAALEPDPHEPAWEFRHELDEMDT